MGMYQRIKMFFEKFIKKESPLLLQEGQIQNESNGIDKYKVNLISFRKEPTLEECFDEFIKQYAAQEEINKGSRNNAYNAYIRMFCGQEEEVENNLKNQEKLKKIVAKKGFEIGNQASKNRLSYLHIMGKEGIDEYKDLNMEKLYINCDRKNIALLTAAIFDKIQGIAGDKLQMKCLSEQILQEDIKREEKNQIKGYQRNEKIVIYAENHEKAERMAEEIKELTFEKPELFSTTKTIPFVPKKYGFIGIAKKEHGEHAKTPLGIAAGNTYNDYMSDIVYQSVISAFDNNLQMGPETLQEPLTVRMGEYARIYPEMEQEQKQAILRKSKEIFESICRENNIKTVYRENESIGNDKSIEK